MPTVLDTLENTIAKIAKYSGTDWPNPWWPTGTPAYNDCAALMSWALFGLNDNQPFYTLVSQIQYYFRGLGRMTRGADGIARGDVVGFLWPGSDDNYSHTEMALGPVDGNGNFQTIGTNSTPDTVAVRVRNTSMVVSYARPDYPGSPTIQPIKENKMAGKISTIRITEDGANDTGQLYWETGEGALIWIENPYDLGLLQRYQAASDNNTHEHYYPAELELLNKKYLARTVGIAPAIDYAALAAAIVKNGGTAPTASQIAKAVNDDAAARLKS